MKIIGKISLYLGIVLLALINLGLQGVHDVHPPPAKGVNTEHWSGTVRSIHDIPFCQTEQKTSPSSQQVNGFVPVKQPAPVGFSRLAHLNDAAATAAKYFCQSRYLPISLKTTDVIFPFHQFW